MLASDANSFITDTNPIFSMIADIDNIFYNALYNVLIWLFLPIIVGSDKFFDDDQDWARIEHMFYFGVLFIGTLICIVGSEIKNMIKTTTAR